MKKKKRKCACWYGVTPTNECNKVGLHFTGYRNRAFVNFIYCPKCGRRL